MHVCVGARRDGRHGWRRVKVAWLLVLMTWIGLLLARPAFAAPAVPPVPDARVTDRVGVMSSATRDSLERRLAAYEQQSGHQIVVWIDRTTGEIPIEDFAVAAFESWKIGRKQLDDGVGLFIMTQDRALRVEVGYGLEPVITDLVAAGVIRSMIPAIERGEWDTAVVGGTEQLVDAIEGQPGSLPADPQPNAEETLPPSEAQGLPRIVKIVGGALLAIFLLILFITNPRLAVLLLVFLGRGGRGGGNGSGFGGGGGRSGGGGASGGW